MLKSEFWLYLDLQKTGCTFLRDKLSSITECTQLQGTKHSAPCAKDLRLPKILTIRDPSTYYFSLWSYGLDRRGGVWKKAQKHLSKRQINKIYGEKNATCFSNFLNFTLNPQPYLTNKIEVDLYTYRILRLLIPSKQKLVETATKLRLKRNQKFFEREFKHYLPEILIPTENMNLYFHKLADSGKLDFLKLRPHWKKIFPLDSSLKNSSKLSRYIDSDEKPNPFLPATLTSKIERKSQLALWLHKKSVDSIKKLN